MQESLKIILPEVMTSKCCNEFTYEGTSTTTAMNDKKICKAILGTEKFKIGISY